MWSLGKMLLTHSKCFVNNSCYYLWRGIEGTFWTRWEHRAAAAKSLQSCLTLCDPMDCCLPGFSIHGILQAKTLEWVAISFSNAGKWKVKVKSLSSVWLLATPWTAGYQATPSMGFSGQQYWSGMPLTSPMETVTDFIFWAPKSVQMVTAAMKLKDPCSLEEKLWST